jgi:hypothetical protein
MAHAYCWRSGEIGIGRSIPEGMLPLARGPAKVLRGALQARARIAYDNVTLLVPGIPEAPDEAAALAAAQRFSTFLTKGEPDLVPALTAQPMEG